VCARFAAELKKQLPRVPLVEDFWTFSEAGRKLAQLHLNYETLEPYPLEEVVSGEKKILTTHHSPLYHVMKMKFPKSGKEVDKSRIIYNA